MPTVYLDTSVQPPTPLAALQISGTYVRGWFGEKINNAALQTVDDFLGSTGEFYAVLNERRQTPNKRLTPNANAAELRSLASEGYSRANKKHDIAAKTVATEIARVKAAIDLKANISKPDRFETFVLNKFASATPEQAQGMLIKAYDEGDTTVLSAVFNAPTSVTNLTPQLLAAYKDEYHKKAAPDEFALLQQLSRADDLIRDGFKALVPTHMAASEGLIDDALEQQKLADIAERLRDAPRKPATNADGTTTTNATGNTPPVIDSEKPIPEYTGNARYPHGRDAATGRPHVLMDE